MGLSDFFKKGKEEPVKKAPAPVQVPKPAVQAPAAAAAQPAAAAAPAHDSYTVASGDSLSKIAKKFYGDASAWQKIYQANKTTIGANPDLIKPGQQLTIPK